MKNKLDKQFSQVVGILGPHQHKKAMVHLLEKYAHRARRDKNIYHRPFGMLLMRTIVDHKRPTKWVPKSELIGIKWNLLAEIRKVGDLDEYECLRPIEKMLVKNVRVAAPTVMELKLKRLAVADAEADLKLVTDTQEACNAMLVCKSIQHNKPAGCPICGGIVSTKGLHCISIHRTSKVETLLSWDIEMQNLAQEEMVARNVLESHVKALKVFTDKLFYHVTSAIQNWWCMFLARRKTAGVLKRMHKSKWYFGIRRLAMIKKRIDQEISDNRLDADGMRQTYPEFSLAISEYVAKIAAIKQAQIDDVARRFLVKLRNAVMRTRKKKFQREELKRMEEKKREALIKKQKGERELADMRLRLKALERRNLICVRPECDLRHFKSQARYDTHMSLHYMRDEEHKKDMAQKAEDELRRGDKERIYRRRLDEVKHALGIAGDGKGKASDDVQSKVDVDGITTIPDGMSLSTHSWADFSELGGGDMGSVGSNWENVSSPVRESSQLLLEEGSLLEEGLLGKEGEEEEEDREGESKGKSEVNTVKGEDGNGGPMQRAGLTSPARARTPASPKLRLSQWANLEKGRDKTVGGMDWSVMSPSSSQKRSAAADASTVITSSTADDGLGGDHDSLANGSMRSMTSLQKREHLREKQRVLEAKHGTIVFDALPPPADVPSPREVDWTPIPHFKQVSADLNAPLHHLELLSKHGDMEVPFRIPLDKPVVRFGSLGVLEAPLKPFGFCRKYLMVSKVHCVVYVPMASGDGPVTVVDNRSLWGTYVVNSDGAFKAPVKVGSGTPVYPGDLICIGVRPKGPQELSPEVAGQACCVYRVRSVALEKSSGTGEKI